MVISFNFYCSHVKFILTSLKFKFKNRQFSTWIVLYPKPQHRRKSDAKSKV